MGSWKKLVWESGMFAGLQRIFCRILKALNLIPSPYWQHRLVIPSVIEVKTGGDNSFKMLDTGLRIEKSLYWKGIAGHEPNSVSIFLKLAAKVDWVIDVGANTGLFALSAKSVNSNLEVYAFEPMPFFYQFLSQNIALNHSGIKAVQKAVSDEEKVLKFYIPEPGKGNLYSSTLKPDHYFGHQQSAPQVIEVGCIRLDSFLTGNHLSGEGLLKIDAEGNDYEVMKSLGSCLGEWLPVMIVENRSLETAKKMSALPGMESYRFFSIPERKGEKGRWIDCPVDDAGRNILFIPGAKIEWVMEIIKSVFVKE